MYIQKLFGLEFFGGEREACDPDSGRDKFTPVEYPITASEREGPFPKGIPLGEVVQRSYTERHQRILSLDLLVRFAPCPTAGGSRQNEHPIQRTR